MQSPYVCTYTILLLPFEYIESIITINIYIYMLYACIPRAVAETTGLQKHSFLR